MTDLKYSKKRKPLAVEARRPSPRQVVTSGIDHQIEFLKDENYRVERYRYVNKVDESGETIRRKQLSKAKPRAWWFQDSDGLYYTQVRYGSSYVMHLKEGFETLECGKTKQSVIDTLLKVRVMVENGELDEQLAAIKKKAQKREKA